MPKAAIFFFVLLLFPMMTNSHASIPVDLNRFDEVQHLFTFNSDIVKIDSNFFTENNYKRYLIFGSNLQNNDF